MSQKYPPNRIDCGNGKGSRQAKLTRSCQPPGCPFLDWLEKKVQGDGVITGCDKTLEWLLPWWWFHYSLFNSYPVLFLDFGMSDQAKAWCKARGEIISIGCGSDFVVQKEGIEKKKIQLWEQRCGPGLWKARNIWHKKPLGLLNTPFERSIWIDIDCEIRKNVSPLFSLCDNPAGLAIRKEKKTVEKHLYKELLPLEKNYNSGVVVFSWRSPAISKWAEKSFLENDQFMGDQETLSRALYMGDFYFTSLTPSMHWIAQREPKIPVIIRHYLGQVGKLQIFKMIQRLNENIFYNS